MSLDQTTIEILDYVGTLKKDQQKVLLDGNFTRIEEYRAACAVLRNLTRIETRIREIAKGKIAADALAEDGLAPMPEENDGRK